MAEKLSNTAFMRELSNTANMDDVEKALIDDMEERDSQRMPKSIQKLLVEERRKRDIRNGVVKPTPTEAREAILRTHGRDALSSVPRGNAPYGPDTQFPAESGLGGFFDKGLGFMQTVQDDGFIAATDALDPNSVGARARTRKARREEVRRGLDVDTPTQSENIGKLFEGVGARPGIQETVAPIDFGGQTLDPVTGQVVQAPAFSAYPSTVREPSPLNTSKKSSSKRKTPQSTAKAPSKAVTNRTALTADPRLSPVLPIPPREALKPTHEDRLAMLNPEYADDPDFGITY